MEPNGLPGLVLYGMKGSWWHNANSSMSQGAGGRYPRPTLGMYCRATPQTSPVLKSAIRHFVIARKVQGYGFSERETVLFPGYTRGSLLFSYLAHEKLLRN